MTSVYARLSLALALTVGIATYLSVYKVKADAPTSQPSTQPGDGDKGHEGHEALEKNMGLMGKAFRKLRAQYKDASMNASSAALAADLQKYATACEDQVPPMAASIPADKRDKFISDFKDTISSLADQFKELQQEFTDGKNDKAAQTVDTIVEIMKEGHKDYRKPESEGGGQGQGGEHEGGRAGDN